MLLDFFHLRLCFVFRTTECKVQARSNRKHPDQTLTVHHGPGRQGGSTAEDRNRPEHHWYPSTERQWHGWGEAPAQIPEEDTKRRHPPQPRSVHPALPSDCIGERTAYAGLDLFPLLHTCRSLGPLQRGQSLRTWDVCATNWAKRRPAGITFKSEDEDLVRPRKNYTCV